MGIWQDEIEEDQVRRIFADNGVRAIQIKYLSRNHNSKNQIYMGGDLSEVATLPMGDVHFNSGTSQKKFAGGKLIYHAPVPWSWVSPSGLSPAPRAQLIVYPQYKEVRLSGLIQGSRDSPGFFMNIEKRGYEEGRLLIYGTNDAKDTAFGMMLSRFSPAAKALDRYRGKVGEIVTIPVNKDASTDSRTNLMRELARIHHMGWMDACELPATRIMRPCGGNRCGGHTLEAHLGITLNGAPAPDFGEWEVKNHGVGSFDRPGSGHITLFTPEPDLGDYAANGTDWFVRQYGIATEDGNRYNFTGRHRVTGSPLEKTGLELTLTGYDPSTKSIMDDGHVGLVSNSGQLVSGWSFSKLLNHWQTKHAFAAYVPSKSQKGTPYKYSYGHRVHLAEGTRFGLFLEAMAGGAIVYDPGIKSELQPNGRWKPKARSQFRIATRAVAQLYDKFAEVNVLEA